VKNGKISAIGKNIRRFCYCSWCKGKHLTSGIIDEHSHIAISNGVNEGGLIQVLKLPYKMLLILKILIFIENLLVALLLHNYYMVLQIL
jgi:hypothetical protein